MLSSYGQMADALKRLNIKLITKNFPSKDMASYGRMKQNIRIIKSTGQSLVELGCFIMICYFGRDVVRRRLPLFFDVEIVSDKVDGVI